MLRIYLICDNIDTKYGMRLVGVDGVVVNDAKSAEIEFDKAVKDKSIGILALTEKAADMIRDHIIDIKMAVSIPLIVEIPDRHGSSRGADSILNYVRDAIGLKI